MKKLKKLDKNASGKGKVKYYAGDKTIIIN